MSENFSIINKMKSRLPRLPILRIKNDILGKNYSLSIAFVSEEESRTLNKKYRGKDNPTNILSFPLNKNTGEIIMCEAVMKKEMGNFEKTFPEFLGFLVIHGMLHLKGLEHSSTMEKAEKLYCKKYDKKHFNRDRRGVVHDASRGRGISKGRKKS
jgi:probable rRNA maturation factor